METSTNEPVKNTLAFTGKGIDLLGILLLNGILTALTFTLYYPWARIKRIRFFWEHTHLNGTAFQFNGTGEELFKSYVRFLVVMGMIYGTLIYSQVTGNTQLYAMVATVLSILIFLIIPLAIHGAFRYRLSRTSWRGIHFGYRGDRTQLLIDFLLGYLFMVITFGVYYSWFVTKIRTYIIGNIRFGSMKMEYTGSGFDLFLISVKGIFLSFITFGIYYFWYYKEWVAYLIENIRIVHEDRTYPVRSKITGTGMLSLLLGNFFIFICTLGLGYAWTLTRTSTYIIEHIELPDEIVFDRIEQTENEYTDATGEYIMDYLDIGII